MSKESKVLMVLGASSDIGSELIKRVAEKYDIILAHYNHTNDNLEYLKKVLGDKLILIKADFSNLEDIQNMINSINEKQLIPNHIVHFSAPGFKYEKFSKTKFNEFEKEIKISLYSLISVLQEYLPQMAKRKCGKIIIMLSASTINMPPKYLSQYVTIKYALLGLVKSLAVEYADKCITINGVSPEMMETKFLMETPELIVKQNASKSPIGRNLLITEVVPTFEFLLSDAANCITGQNIAITAGK